MQTLVLAALMAVIICVSVQCAEHCYAYIRSLNDIHAMLEAEDNYHNYNMKHYAGPTFVERTQYILEKLNADLNRARQHNRNGYNQHKYYNQQGGAKQGNECKQLEDAILAKSKEFGIEKIGLESNLVRLRKVLDYQDERNNFYSTQNEECRTREQKCDEDKTTMEGNIEALNATRAELHQTIKSLNDTVTKLQKENKLLVAKLNANAPAIHGATGVVYPATGRSVNNTSSFSTTETPVTVQNATSAEADEVSEPSSVIPDIDLRNDAS